jgi:hypothetical protein
MSTTGTVSISTIGMKISSIMVTLFGGDSGEKFGAGFVKK